MERAWKPNVEMSPNCPRCGSSNTKFCYYNNYSLTQPRYFCKGCRRYWTKGGSLRNVPVGGGCRKNRRGKPIRLSSSATTSSAYLAATSNPFGSGMSCGTMSRGSNSSFADPTSSSNGSSHIDLALVYANYLNQKPEQAHEELAGGESDHHDSQPLANVKQVHDLDNVELMHGNELLGCEFISELFAETHLSNGNNQIYSRPHHHGEDSNNLNGISDRIQPCDGGDASFFGGLPPLPSEGDGTWLNDPTDHLMVNRGFEGSELMPFLGPEANLDLLTGNWREFDLSVQDANFSRK